MSRNRITWSGLDEFTADLRAMPKAVVDEVTPIVVGAAEAAKADMHYPRITGNLGDHLSVKTIPIGPFGVKAVVTNPSPLAAIFEHGTEARHYVTKNGTTHLLGRMPVGNVFIPACMRARRAMAPQIAAVLEAHGLTVSGDAAA